MKKNNMLMIISGVFVTIVFYFISKESFIAFHIAIESVFLVFGVAIFLIAHVTYKIKQDSLISQISSGLLIASVLVFIHSFFYPGTNFFNVDEANYSTQIWLVSNFILSITILYAVSHTNKPNNLFVKTTIISSIALLLLLSVYLGLFPDTYLLDSGLTNFKIIVEYIIIILFIISLVVMQIKKDSIPKEQFYDLFISIIIFAIAEFIFTLYKGPYDFFGFFGHILRVFAILFLYKSMIKKDFSDPLNSIFHELNEEIESIRQQAEMVRKSEAIFKALYDKAPLGYQSLDEAGFLLYANDAYAELLGYEKGELIGKNFGDLLDTSGSEVFAENFGIFKSEGKTQVIIAMKHKNGSVIPVRFVGRISRNNDGSFQRTHCILMDVSNELEYQKSLLANEEKLSNILDATSEGIFGIDLDKNCIFVNKIALKLLGYESIEELQGVDIHKVLHHTEIDCTEISNDSCNIYRSLVEKAEINAENELFFRKDGTSFAVEYSSVPQFKKGKIIGAVISFRNITERKLLNETLVRLSYKDNLTNTYNRRYYEKELINIDKRQSYPLSIVMGDINGLKLVNDAFGHKVGDHLLVKASRIIQKEVGSKGIVARIGGDEFVMVLPSTSREEAEIIVKNINMKSKKVLINSIPLSISFGISSKTLVTEDIEEVFKSAEDAMYREKLLKIPSMRSDAIETIMLTLNEKDVSSEKHSRLVSVISVNLAKAAGLNREKVQRVRTAGLLHDIGKIIIPINIINKKDKLLVEEYEEIKKHPEIGFRILNSSHNMRSISEIVLSHHENFDGTGYPRGFAGDNIPIESRIISIADAFDAMTSEREYRKVLNVEEALEEIKACSGTQFDPDLANIFIKNYKKILEKL